MTNYNDISDEERNWHESGGEEYYCDNILRPIYEGIRDDTIKEIEIQHEAEIQDGYSISSSYLRDCIYNKLSDRSIVEAMAKELGLYDGMMKDGTFDGTDPIDNAIEWLTNHEWE